MKVVEDCSEFMNREEGVGQFLKIIAKKRNAHYGLMTSCYTPPPQDMPVKYKYVVIKGENLNSIFCVPHPQR